MRGTFDVRGLKVRTQTTRRYIVVAYRPTIEGQYPAWARVVKRTDSIETARAEARRWRGRSGQNPIEYTIINTETGNDVG